MGSSPVLLTPLGTPVGTPRRRFPRFHNQQNPSLSPQKFRIPAPDFSKPRAKSDSAAVQFQMVTQEPVDKSEIEFEDFSFWDAANNDFKKLSDEEDKILFAFLVRTYKATACQADIPYLLVWTAVPPETDNRPFSIAGLVVVWMQPNTSIPGFSDIGSYSETDKPLSMHKTTADKLSAKDYIPNKEDAKILIDYYFPVANGICFIPGEIIIELPRQEKANFNALLQVLPDYIEDTDIQLKYLNGDLSDLLDEASSRQERLQVPKLEQPDYADYLTGNPPTLQPGVALAGPDGEYTAGIFVKKGNNIRMLVPYHCYESLDVRNLGNPTHFWVNHHDVTIGVVDERIGDTDFGLARIHNRYALSNQFMGIQAIAKKLVRSRTVAKSQVGLIDTFVCPVQKLRLRGTRIFSKDKIVKGERTLKAQYPFKDKGEEIQAGFYTVYEQNIITTGDPALRYHKTVQSGACGAAIIRKGKPREDNLHLGEIVGIVHWSDLTEKTASTDTVIGLADAPDELMDAGWEVANFGEWT